MKHPDDETLALFAEGKLPRQEVHEVLAHLGDCADCLRAVRGANEVVREEKPVASGSSWRPRLLAIAAAAVIVVLGLTTLVPLRRERTPVERLVALAPRDARTVEPRLSGSFPWAPYRGPMRANGAGDTRNFRLVGAAGEILEEAERSDDAHLQQAAGAALVLVERPQEAIARLRAAAEKHPSDATLWNDLGAATHAAGLQLNQQSRFPEALEAFDRAVSLDPRSGEALFNRALTLQRLGLHIAAREAWKQYLRVDPASPWSAEARAHLQRLPATTGESRFRNDHPQLERAVAGGDQAAVDAFVRQYPQGARTFTEVETLGQWAASRSQAKLAVARTVGESLVRLSGEMLLRDAVVAIDRGDEGTRQMLAEAHLAYRRGRLAYSRQAPAAAEPELRRAAELFAAAGSPMALVARYFAANTRYDQNEVIAARRELEALLLETAPHAGYKALGAQVRWELALCLMTDDDWTGALPYLLASARAFDALGERSNRGFIDSLYGDALAALGQPDEAWAARIRSFEALSGMGWGDRLAISLGAAVRTELRAGRLAAARALSRIELDALRTTGNDFTVANALVRVALLDAELGRPAVAAATLTEASIAASRILDDDMRARSLADVQFARGAVLLREDPRTAAASLGEALDGYLGAEARIFLPETLLLRARAALRLGDRDAALRELEHGAAAYERHGETTVLDAGRALYEEAIRLTLENGNTAAAFAWSERALGARADTLQAVQKRLEGTGAVILELAMARGEVIAFLIKVDDVQVIRRVDSYERLLRDLPVAGATQLLIVADPRLDGVALAASQLVERVAVAFAPNASALRSEAPAPFASLAAVGVASRDLPSSREELAELVQLYPRIVETSGTFASLLGAKADVLHVSGHAETGNDATLLFRGERISSRRISASKLQGHPLVVLAACETLRARRSPQRRALSLGEGFLAAGARGVIGTLAPIPDNDARAIFGSIHHHLATGRGPAEAVRQAQLESMAADRNGAWRSVALLTRTVEIRKESS